MVLKCIKFEEFFDLEDIFLEFLNFRNEDYTSIVPSNIVYTYKFIKSSSVLGLDKDKVKVNSDLQKSKFNRSNSIITMTMVKSSPKYSFNRSLNFKGFNLPDTMDYSKWGTIIFQSDLFAEVKKLTSKFSYHINILDKSLLVTLKYKDKIILEFTDEQIEKGKLNSFIRKIKNQKYIFIDGKIVLKKIKKQVKFIAGIINPSTISKKLFNYGFRN